MSGGFNIPCALQFRWAATVLDLILFLGGYPSDVKDWNLGWAVLFLSVADFFSLTVMWGVKFGPISVVSSVSKGGFTSKWVYVVTTTGGGENSHLSSRRNAWGDCRGVTGGASSLSFKGSSDISGKGSTGRKGSLPLKLFILLISLSSSNKSCEQSILQTFHLC